MEIENKIFTTNIVKNLEIYQQAIVTNYMVNHSN